MRRTRTTARRFSFESDPFLRAEGILRALMIHDNGVGGKGIESHFDMMTGRRRVSGVELAYLLGLVTILIFSRSLPGRQESEFFKGTRGGDTTDIHFILLFQVRTYARHG